jgi:hypothetical protein
LIVGTEGSGANRCPQTGLPGQLYNLVDDPGEQNNLWGNHPDMVKRLTELLETYKQQGHSHKVV